MTAIYCNFYKLYTQCLPHQIFVHEHSVIETNAVLFVYEFSCIDKFLTRRLTFVKVSNL